MQHDLIKKFFLLCHYFICSISYYNFYISITFSIKFICVTMTKTREFCIINFYFLSKAQLFACRLVPGWSRRTPFKARPSKDPDVRLSRIRLLTKRIVRHLSFVYTNISPWNYQHRRAV